MRLFTFLSFALATALAAQSATSGDSKEKIFSAPDEDVTPVELIEPSSWPIYNGFSPTARFEERAGQEMQPYVYLNCKIENMDTLSAPGPLYQDSILHAFEPYESYTAVFPEANIESSSIMITFWACNIQYTPISNPPLVAYFSGGVEEANPGMLPEPSLDVALSGGQASIHFTLPADEEISLDVYDVSGKRVGNVLDTRLGAGEHRVDWDIDGAPRGVYFVRLAAGKSVNVAKLVIEF
jgi:hypothetical protein